MAIRALLSFLSEKERTRLISGLDVHAGEDEQDEAEKILDKLVNFRGVRKNPPKRRHGPKPAKSTNSTEETLRFHLNEIRKFLEYGRREKPTLEMKWKPSAEYKRLSDLEVLQFSLKIFETFHTTCRDELYLTRQERRTLAHACLQGSKRQNGWLSRLNRASGPFALSSIPSRHELCTWLWAPLSNCTMFHLGGWVITHCKTHTPCGSDIQIPTFGCRMTHVETGIVVTAKQSLITSVQASLPRVLYGSNGICLSSDEEIQKALTIISQRVDEVATEPQRRPLFKSVHFTLNLPCDPRKVIQAHSHAKFIFVHSDAESYSSDLDRYHHRNLRWKGANVVLTMYNKALEMTRRNPGHIKQCKDCLRIELQVKATKLLNFLINDNKDIPVDALSAAKSYAVLRAALCTFTKITPSSNFKISTINLLALAIANGLKGPAGEDLLELYRPTVESETFRKNRKLILQTAHKYTQFDWNKELPERLTRFVNVHPDGREELITLPVPLPADPGPNLSQYGRKKEPVVPLPAPPTMVPQ